MVNAENCLGDSDALDSESGYFEVVALFSHPVEEILHLTIDDDGSDPLAPEVIEITPNHPVYLEGKSWVEAENLALGDRLRRADGGWARVLAIERVVLDEPVVVYNFTVRGIHTYFVLEVGVLVHNCGGPIRDANVQRWRDPQTGRITQPPDILDRASICWSQNAVSDDVFWLSKGFAVQLRFPIN